MGYQRPSIDLKKRLKDEMERTGPANGLMARGSFVSDVFIAKLLTKENIDAHLRREHGVWRPWFLPLPSRLAHLPSRISEDAPKLYCILLLLDMSSEITALLDNNKNDRTLFGREGSVYRTICTQARLNEIDQLDEKAKSDFFRLQHSFMPILYPLHSSDDIPEFDPVLFKLPFNTMTAIIGQGSFGVVQGTTINAEYIRRVNNDQPVVQIAYKRIIISNEAKHDKARRDKIYREVYVLRNRLHPNLTELLGSFLAGLEISGEGGSPQLCLYMLYPRARMDMRRWLDGKQLDFLKTKEETVEQHIWSSAILGLASGLTFLHREVNKEVGYHRDLKPDNILLFEGENWTWKIADFGCANLKSVEDTKTQSLTTTHYWAPAEYFDHGSDKGKHARAHDIYSLGCILLVFATVIVHGFHDSGLVAFAKRRRQYYDQHPSVKGAKDPEAFSNSETVVQGWISELQDKRSDDERLKGVLGVIREMLLPYKERIWAWEAEVYLYDAIEERTDTKVAKVLQRLEKVCQESREVHLDMQKTPFSRAQDRRKSAEFFEVLKKKKWYDVTPQSTEELRQRAARPGRLLSTFAPEILSKDPIFGYQQKFCDMTEGFSSQNVVVLCGLGGVGKTHMAISYASQFFESNTNNEHKHTFWVSMRDADTILDGYKRIAAEINLPEESSAAHRVSDIEYWLRRSDIGPWLLVVDDLSTDPELFKNGNAPLDLLNLMSIQHHGQILITTRRRPRNGLKMIDELDYMFITLTPPSFDDRLRIYDHFAENESFPSMDDNVSALLKKLVLPKLIKEAIVHMKNLSWTPQILLKRIEDEGDKKINDFSPDLAEFLLRHLWTKSLVSEPKVSLSNEVQVVFLLAMFGQEGVSFEFLKIEMGKEAIGVLDQTLATLQNSFLAHRSKSLKETYHINWTVEVAVLASIWKEGYLAVLMRFNKVLSMIFTYYTFMVDRGLSKFDIRKEVLPQFQKFLRFVKMKRFHEENTQFTFHPNAIQAIIEFAKMCSDKDQYGEAVELLEFAAKHYLLDQSPDQDLTETLRIQYALNQQRMNAYLAYPVNDSNKSYYSRAERIVREQIDAAALMDQMPFAGFVVLMHRWRLSLDLVDVCCYLKKWECAREQLALMDKLDIVIKDQGRTYEPWIPRINEVDLGVDRLATARTQYENQRILKMLAVRRKCIEGHFHLARGCHADEDGQREQSISCWSSAKEASRIAKVAMAAWFPGSEIGEEVLMDIADANIKLGLELTGALETFQTMHGDFQANYGNDCLRTWAMECRIHAVKLQLGQDLNTTTKSLKELLAKYEARLSKFDKRATATVRCASQLVEAYTRTYRRDDARELSDRFELRSRPEGRITDWVSPGTSVLVLGCLCSFFMFHRRDAVVRLWLGNGAPPS